MDYTLDFCPVVVWIDSVCHYVVISKFMPNITLSYFSSTISQCFMFCWVHGLLQHYDYIII